MGDVPRRVGVFGGTFDPIHNGHLLMAEQAREILELDEVLFIPAAVPPHKRSREITPARHRIAMIEAAIADNDRFRLSTIEIDRPGPSYTVDTIRQLKASHPDVDLHLVLGADSLADFPNWREPDAIASLSSLVVVRRPGSPEPDVTLLATAIPADAVSRIRVVDTPRFEVASRDLRRRAAAGASLRYLVPDAVVAYIVRNHLYRFPAEG